MKRIYFNKKIIIISLIFLLGIICFLDYSTSYAVQVESNDYVSATTVTDSDILADFLSKANNVEFEIDNEEVTEEKEDPEVIIKEQEAKKGTAKKSTAKEAREKYETNETSLGIDVSYVQGDIDWKQVKASGINFAMIRVGFRGMVSGKIVEDKYFDANMKGAIANNINVGVYFFSMAKNSTEALEEAKWVTNKIKNYDISYPVAIDIEVFNKYRLKDISYATMTNNAIVFCNYIKKQGYTPIIYSYYNAFNNYFDTAKFSGYRIWLAQYNDTATYKGNYHMWQYTSKGIVPGIDTRVDLNVAYFSITNDSSKKANITGISQSGNINDVSFISMNMNTTLTKTVTLRSSPYLNYPNKAGTLDKGTRITVTGINDDFIRIVYDNNVFYVNDINSFVYNYENILFTEEYKGVITNKSINLLYKPYNYLKNNTYKNLSSGTEIKVVGISTNYTKIEYENNIYYVEDIDFYIEKEEIEVIDDSNDIEESSNEDET